MFYTARFGVTEIGEKEKMKNKLVATVMVLTILLAMAIIPINVKFGKADDVYYYLTIKTKPSGLAASATIPTVGVYKEPAVSWINVTALDIVPGTTGVRYKFDYWDKNGTKDLAHSVWAIMNGNLTYTAFYTTQYLLTVIVPSNSLWLKNFTAYASLDNGASWIGGTGPSVSAWANAYTLVKAAVSGQDGLFLGTPWVYGKHTNELARFINWTGYGYTIDPTPSALSGSINMTGPKSPVMEWAYYYYLYVSSTYDVPAALSKQNWYKVNSKVVLSATEIFNNGAWARQVPDYWEVDKVKVLVTDYTNYTVINPHGYLTAIYNLTITVNMNTNHTAVIHFKTQYYLQFVDDLGPGDGSWTGVNAQSGYYDANKIAPSSPPFTAPRLALPAHTTNALRYRFYRWFSTDFSGFPRGNLTNRDFTLNVTNGGKIIAQYKTQWYIQIFTKPTCPSLLPLMYLKGWTGDPGWFDHLSTATFGAPAVYDFHNGTKLMFKEWDYDGGVFHSNQNNTQWAGVWHAENFTAVYTKYYRLTLKAEPAIFAWEKEYWAQEGFWGWFWPDATWKDPGGYMYYFDHWTVTPYANLDGPTWLGVNLNTSYTATAYYRLGTTLVMDPLGVEAQNAGHGYCTTFKMSIKVTNVKDMYAVQAKVNFVNTHLKIVGVDTTPLNLVWGTGKWFVADDLDYTDGYDFYATALGNNTKSFTGSAVLVAITFHIIYEPCVLPDIWDWIYFSDYALYYKNGTTITPLDPVLNGRYHMKVLEPALKGVATISNGGHTVTIDIYAVNVTKLHDYTIWLDYDTNQLKLKTWWFDTSFLQGVYAVNTPWIAPGVWSISVVEITGYLANGTGSLLHLVFDAVLVGSALDKITFDPVKCHISEKCDQGIIYIYHQGGSYTFLDLMDATMPDPLAGDANLDGVVDIYDLRLVAYYLGKLTTVWGGPAPPSCDFDHDGWITMRDLITVAVNFGHHI